MSGDSASLQPPADSGAGLVDPSAMPVRERGVRSRAGNAMGRTRAAVLDGALRAVAAEGARKTTMADIAAAAGIAKGTLYNHFRAKEAVFSAAAEAAVQRLGDESAKLAADSGLAAGLGHAARSIAESPTLAKLREEPAALQPLLLLGEGPAWDAACEAAGDLLTAGGAAADAGSIDLLLRWSVSYIAAPSTDAIDGAAAMLATALLDAARPTGMPSAEPQPEVQHGEAPLPSVVTATAENSALF